MCTPFVRKEHPGRDAIQMPEERQARAEARQIDDGGDRQGGETALAAFAWGDRRGTDKRGEQQCGAKWAAGQKRDKRRRRSRGANTRGRASGTNKGGSVVAVGGKPQWKWDFKQV